jgi:uncharacterized protein (TIGR03000 family)
MLRKVLSVTLVLILAGVGLDLAADTGQAAPHGGGHVGGGFHGGAHFGGFRGGAHLGGFRGGVHSPGLYHGYRPGAYYHRYNYPRYYNRYYGAWPYSYGYSYPTYPYYYNPSGGGGGVSDDASGQGYLQEPDYDAGVTSAPSTAPQDARAEVTLTLPTDATLWAMGQKIPGTGSRREYYSPTLPAGHRYTYDFRARWQENGRTVTQTQSVDVTPGAHVEVHFPVPPTRTHTAPGH